MKGSTLQRTTLSAAIVALLSLAILTTQGPQRAEAAALLVLSSADSGPGSFRAAVEQANSNPRINRIVLKNSSPITLLDAVEYTGQQNLTILGDGLRSNRVIQGTGVGADTSLEEGCALFRSNSNADITITQVTFRDTQCHGVEVYGSSESPEAIGVSLNKTTIRNVGGHGLYIHEGVAGGDAAVSFNVKLLSSRFELAGADHADEIEPECVEDGVFIAEQGSGGIAVTAINSAFMSNCANGLDVEEADGGDITLTAVKSNFNSNGEDGAGVNEGADGSLKLTFTNVEANTNGAVGLNFNNEDGAGNASLTAAGVTADGNRIGISMFEHDDGQLTVQLFGVHTHHNSGEGVDAREFGSGNYRFQAIGSSANMNGWGYTVLEFHDGDLAATFASATANGNRIDGFQVEEAATGRFLAWLVGSTATSNNTYALRAVAGDEPGTLVIIGSRLIGDRHLDNVTVIP